MPVSVLLSRGVNYARDNLLLLMYIKPTDLMFVGFFNTINMVCLII